MAPIEHLTPPLGFTSITMEAMITDQCCCHDYVLHCTGEHHLSSSLLLKGSLQRGVGCSMGPPFVLIEGEGSHQGKVGFTPLYPGVNPTPHWLPVPHWCGTQIPGR